jgi:hypothetical protein
MPRHADRAGGSLRIAAPQNVRARDYLWSSPVSSCASDGGGAENDIADGMPDAPMAEILASVAQHIRFLLQMQQLQLQSLQSQHRMRSRVPHWWRTDRELRASLIMIGSSDLKPASNANEPVERLFSRRP